MTDDAPQNVDRDPVTGSRSSASQADIAPPPPTPAGGRARRRKEMPIWQEMFLLLGMALVLAVVIKAFFMQAFYIPSGSMNDTLVLDDRILVQKVSYWQGEPQRGDIVVFADPGGWLNPGEVRTADGPFAQTLEMFGLYPTGGHLVKRVIGVGGDRVKCCDKQGQITVNGTPLDETSYLPKGTLPSDDEFDVRVPEEHLWVMGDNRDNSYDSRGHLGDPGGGMVSDDLVVGKVWALIWPWKRAKWVHTPESFKAVPSP